MLVLWEQYMQIFCFHAQQPRSNAKICCKRVSATWDPQNESEGLAQYFAASSTTDSHQPLQHKLRVVRTLTCHATTIITRPEDLEMEMEHIH